MFEQKQQKQETKITEPAKPQTVSKTEAPPPKKKRNRADFMFKQKSNEILVKKPGDLEGLDFAIKDLDSC